MEKIKLFLCICLSFIFVKLNSEETRRIYLSGTDVSEPQLWDFKCSNGLNSGVWTKIPVPSNWEMVGFGNLYYGSDPKNWNVSPEIGYYKYTFELPEFENKTVELVFQASMTDTKVFVNGKSAGPVHYGGFTAFKFDVTALVKKGNNLLEVEVQKQSSNVSVQKSERIGDFWLFGGIFRPVYLEIHPEEHIDRMAIDANMYGDIKMDIFIKELKHTENVKIELYDKKSKILIDSALFEVEGDSLRINKHYDNIELWSDEAPNLYLLKVSLLSSNDKEIHTVTEQIGFRTFEVRNKQGFFLNGKRILLKGAARHSFRPETGRALSFNDWSDDIIRMKYMNMNVVRCCHYPPDEGFLDLCDEMGMLAIDEITGWIHPLENVIGEQIVRETVLRDMNHPSVILWTNGNHNCYNPFLEHIFYNLDIQKRRALRTEPKTSKKIDVVTPGHDPVDTRYYPDYSMLKQRLDSCYIVFPMETLHSLYDGGGGAGLTDFWNEMEKSPVGGGLIFWSLYDEGIINTSHGIKMDVQGNLAPDGLMGPNGEQKGSCQVVRKIWSPVEFDDNSWNPNNGSIAISNKYLFTSLSECSFDIQYVIYPRPEDARTKSYCIAREKVNDFDLKPGCKSAFVFPLYHKMKNQADAVDVKVYNKTGLCVMEWSKSLVDNRVLANKIMFDCKGRVEQLPDDKFSFYLDGELLKFNSFTGILESVSGEKVESPYIVYESVNHVENKQLSDKGKPEVRSYKVDDGYCIEAYNVNSFDTLKWNLRDNGILSLSYSFTLPEGEYYYAGIGWGMSEDSIIRKKWLGYGPYRVYKNRINAGTLNVWQMDKVESIPGEKWNFPEFDGYFSDWSWIALGLKHDRMMAFSTHCPDLALGIGIPKNGIKPVEARWFYPEKEGIYFFNYISTVGSKWKKSFLLGPSGNYNYIAKPCTGSVNVRLNYTNSVVKSRFRISLE